MMNLTAFSFKRLAACAALALCVAAGSATNAAAHYHNVVGGNTEPAWTIPGYPGNPTNTICCFHGETLVYRIVTPGCSGWSWNSAQRLYNKSCYYGKYTRDSFGFERLEGFGLAWWTGVNGTSSCWGSYYRPYHLKEWTNWFAGWCPRFS